MTTEREIILDALMEILEKKQYSHLVMRATLDKYAYLPVQKRRFIKRCCEGTVEQMICIDHALSQFSKTPVKKMKPLIRTVLRMSAYQILFMDSVPDSAACNEAVSLAKKRGFTGLSGFVNGVLRSLSRGKNTIAYPDRSTDPEGYLSIRYSMPRWIVTMWLQQYGEEKTEKMLEGLLAVRPVTIRMREGISDAEKEQYLGHMTEDNITWERDDTLPYAYYLQNVDNISGIPGFAQGRIALQDIGSMWVVELADIKKGDFVVDVCSAPGGKAIHAADKLCGSGSVLARDLTDYKISLIQDNIDRCKVSCMTTQVWDATIRDESLTEKADVVIADLPCSGLGVIGRKGDIKYRVRQDDIAAIAALQKDILQAVWPYVKKGGTLMFSTCTVTAKENEGNRDWILQNLQPILQPTCEEIQTLFPCLYCIQTLSTTLPSASSNKNFFVPSIREVCSRRSFSAVK